MAITPNLDNETPERKRWNNPVLYISLAGAGVVGLAVLTQGPRLTRLECGPFAAEFSPVQLS